MHPSHHRHAALLLCCLVSGWLTALSSHALATTAPPPPVTPAISGNGAAHADVGDAARCTLQGTVHYLLHNTKVYLYDIQRGAYLDSATVVGQRFWMSVPVDSAMLALLLSPDSAHGFEVPCLLEPAATLTVDAQTHVVQGTPANDVLCRYLTTSDSIVTQIRIQSARMSQVAGRRYSRLQAQRQQLFHDFFAATVDTGLVLYRRHHDDLVGTYILYRIIQLKSGDYLAIDDPNPWSATQIDSVLRSASPLTQHFAPLQPYRLTATPPQPALAGLPYRDFTAREFVTMQPVALSSLIAGRLAVLSFWNAAQCHAEIQQSLIPLYQQYKRQGLVIVGINAHDSDTEHDRAAKVHDIPYPLLLVDDDSVARLYGVTTYPTAVVIDPDGVMLGVYNGAALRQVVVDWFAQHPDGAR